MRRLFATFFGMIIGGVLVYLAFNFHLVRTPDEWVFARKTETSITDWYVDVRNWDATNWQSHPALANALIEKGRRDLVKKTSIPEGLFQDLLRFRKHEGAALPEKNSRRE